MTKTGLKCIASCASLCLMTATAFAQADSSAGQPASSSQTSTKESGQSQQFCKSKDIVGATVKDSQGEKLGSVHEVFLNPQNGQTFAAIDIGQSRNALVPLQALNVSAGRGLFHKTEATLNKTKSDLESGPMITNNQWQNLDDASFTQRIYSHYNIQPPSAVGGTGAGTSTSGASTSSSTKSNQQP